MRVYTVHEPPLGKSGTAPSPERFVFVRDSFSFWAFLFGPLWMLWHRMWLVLIAYMALMAALIFGLRYVGASGNVPFVVEFLVALLVGFEAATLLRFTLGRRRYRQVGLVAADNLEAAEQRFFDAWASQQREPVPTAPPAEQYALAAPIARLARRTDVIGLFPQGGGRA